MNHKQWLDNEYNQWIKALQESTVENFKEHPMVQRMLSEDVDPSLYQMVYYLEPLLYKIDNIGRTTPKPVSGACYRMAYYALKVLEQKPKCIIEIGGGVGQFFIILLAMGYNGEYACIDLPEVMIFQHLYRNQTSEILNINTTEVYTTETKNMDFICSFYAFGEFDDNKKKWYTENLITKCKHGLILYNPHSGASEEIPFKIEGMQVKDEYPKSSPNVNVKEISW